MTHDNTELIALLILEKSRILCKLSEKDSKRIVEIDGILNRLFKLYEAKE